MNAVYWGLTALCVMGHKDALDRDETLEFVMSCWDDEAGLSMVVCRYCSGGSYGVILVRRRVWSPSGP
jgi:prenyltransferase beta subunit